LHELLVAKLTADRTEDAGAARLPVVLQDHGGVLVELDVRAVGTAGLLDRAHHDRLDDIALLDVAAGDGVLHRGDDDVAQARVAAVGAAEHADGEQLLGARVVGDLESRFVLDHLAFSRISTRRQRLVALSGRVSLMRTRSPMPAELFSSCALTFEVRRMTLP